MSIMNKLKYNWEKARIYSEALIEHFLTDYEDKDKHGKRKKSAD